MPLSPTDIIEIAKVSGYLSADDVSDGQLYGEGLNNQLPQTIYLVRKGVQWKASFNVTGVNATGYITIIAVGNDGDNIQVYVQDPELGLIFLGGYTKQSSDTTPTILASSIAAAITGSFGYTAVGDGENVVITARDGIGASINGGTNLTIIITNAPFPNIFDNTFSNTFN